MRRAKVAALLTALALCPSWARAAAPHLQYPWLTVDLATSPDLAAIDLPIDEERVQQLEKAGFGFTDLLVRTEVHLDEAGWVRERTTGARHYFSAQGVRAAGNVTLYVRAGQERLVLESAYVLAPDGAIHVVRKGEIQVIPNAQPNVFSDVYGVVIAFGGLVPGATAVAVFTRSEFAPDWPFPWSRIYSINPFAPIEDKEVAVSWGAGVREPRWASDGGVVCARSTSRSFSCRWPSQTPISIEPQSPSIFDLSSQLVVTQSGSWAEVVRGVSALADSAVDSDAKLAEQLHRLLDGAITFEERLQRLQRFVADEIRYVAFEHGTGAVTPRQATQTLDRRYGDCKDKVVLFLALARGAGIDAYPVLTHFGRHSIDRLIAPSGLYFNHMIACIDQGEAKTCVDLTSSETPAAILPPWLAGAVALELREGSSGPSQLSAPTFSADVVVETSNEVGCDGSVKEVSKRRFLGSHQVALRLQLRPMASDARQRWAEEEYRQLVSSRRPSGIRVGGVDSASAPLTISSEVQYPGVGPVASLDLFRDRDPWLDGYARSLRTGNRQQAYRMPGLRMRSRANYQICRDSEVAAFGPTLDFEDSYGSLRRSYARTADGVVVETVLTLPRREVGVGELERFNLFLDVITSQTRIWFGLRKRQ